MQIPIKIPTIFSTEVEQKILAFVSNHRRLWITTAIFGKKNKTMVRITLCDFKLDYKVVIIKTVWY